MKLQNLFKLDAFEWDTDIDEPPPDLKTMENTEWHDDEPYNSSAIEENEEPDGISALTDIPSFCWAECFIYRKASEERDLKRIVLHS